jgi:ribonuclease D
MIDFLLIQNEEQLREAAQEWEKQKILAIDLECENNLHHYGMFLSLVQISSKTKNWVVDVLNLKNINPLLAVLKNKEIVKIFHDVSFDLRILLHQFDCKVKNIFDTQLAATFLGYEKIGLASLLEEFFKIKKDTKFQRIDWTKRPLSLAMLNYAAKDTAYLLDLKTILKKKLEQQKRLDWLKEEFAHLEKVDFTYHEQEYINIPGVKSMSDKERAIFHKLFSERKKLAKKVDKPVFKVIRNQQLLAFAEHPPQNWKYVKGVHPIVRQEAVHLGKIVKTAGKEEYEPPKKKKFSSQQLERIKELLTLRKKLSEKYKLKEHLILSQDQIKDIVITDSYNCLRDWQKKLLIKQKD